MNSRCQCEGALFVNDCEIEWRIHDVFGFPLDQRIEIDSRKFSIAGRTWILKIIPNGRIFENTQGWFGIALCAIRQDSVSVSSESLFVRLSIIGEAGKMVSSIPKRKGKWYRADRLIKLEDFKSRKKEFAPGNELTVLCEIRNLAAMESESDDEEWVEATEGDMIVHNNDSSSKPEYGDCSETTKSPDSENAAQSVTLDCIKGNIDSTDEGHAEEDQENEPTTEKKLSPLPKDSTDEGHTEKEQENELIIEKKLLPLPKGIAKALQDYKALLLSGRHTDIIIQVKNKQFKAHKEILAARNPVFAAMLEHNMKEKATGVVKIEDMDPEAFPDFLEYLYTGQVQNLSSGNVLELFTAADKYQVKELREECYVFMKGNMSVNNFCGIMSVSLRHHEKELIALATQFFIENAVDIVKTSNWQIFMMENVVAANELFIKQLEFNNRNQKQK